MSYHFFMRAFYLHSKFGFLLSCEISLRGPPSIANIQLMTYVLEQLWAACAWVGTVNK